MSSTPAIASEGLDESIATEPSASARAEASESPSGLKVTQADARSAIQPPSLASSVSEQQSSSAGPAVYSPPPVIETTCGARLPPKNSKNLTSLPGEDQRYERSG